MAVDTRRASSRPPGVPAGRRLRQRCPPAGSPTEAGVPLSQIHYHFGGQQGLVLALLDDENQRLVDRQRSMYAADVPLWQRYEQACDFLDDDLASGYVRVLQEMIAAGWSDPAVADKVTEMLGGWFDLLAAVARRGGRRASASLGPVSAGRDRRAGRIGVPRRRGAAPVGRRALGGVGAAVAAPGRRPAPRGGALSLTASGSEEPAPTPGSRVGPAGVRIFPAGRDCSLMIARSWAATFGSWLPHRTSAKASATCRHSTACERWRWSRCWPSTAACRGRAGGSWASTRSSCCRDS